MDSLAVLSVSYYMKMRKSSSWPSSKFKNQTSYVVLMIKNGSSTNFRYFRSVKPNLSLVLKYLYSIAIFVSGNPEYGNSVQIVETNAAFGFGDRKVVDKLIFVNKTL